MVLGRDFLDRPDARTHLEIVVLHAVADLEPHRGHPRIGRALAILTDAHAKLAHR